MVHLSTGHPVWHRCLYRMSGLFQMQTGLKTPLSHILETFFNWISFVYLMRVCVFDTLTEMLGQFMAGLVLCHPSCSEAGTLGPRLRSLEQTQLSRTPCLVLHSPCNPLILTTRDDYLLITASSFSVIAKYAD